VAYDLGDVAALAINITDSTGAAANATTVTVTITKPDGTSESPATPTNGTVGSYTYNYTPATVGRYSVRWLATGTNACAMNDAFDVRAAASTNLISLAEAKAAMNSTATTAATNDEIRDYLETATSLIEAHIGPVIQRTFTQRVTGWDCIVLSNAPVVSITSLTGVYNNATAVLAAAVTVDSCTGIVRKLDRSTFSGETYDVVYVAGRSSGVVDPLIQQAARITLAHLWRTQRGPATPRLGGVDQANETFSPTVLLPLRALELLRTFKRSPGIA